VTADQLHAAHRALTDLRVELDTAYLRGDLSDDDADEFLRMLAGLALFLNLKPLNDAQN
jgi:hypothetical protein